ncbi:MAG: hypothetical protein ACOZIN_06525 [Myxococcota bacterium]
MVVAVLYMLLAAAPTEALAPPHAEHFKALVLQGEALFEQGEYGAAIYQFRLADGVQKTPEVAFNLAKCHEKIGDEAFAAYYYRLYLRRAPSARDALEVAGRVGGALVAAEASGRGFLEVEAEGAVNAAIQGQSYPETPVATFLPPGDYELSAEFPSGVKKLLVQLRTGKVTTVSFEPLPPPLLTPESVLSAELAEAGATRKALRVASYATFGASAAALIAGTVVGAMASSDAGQLSSGRGQLTVSQARAVAASANGKGGTANLLWIASGVGAAAGGVLFVFSLPEPGMKEGR